ncbi:MAG: hypothetical protein EOO41_00210 [Methanobacteriota archaeon]|nr:MAG: hypothetical protein EOO41_00210 [Euryarchaeota archaeon]
MSNSFQQLAALSTGALAVLGGVYALVLPRVASLQPEPYMVGGSQRAALALPLAVCAPHCFLYTLFGCVRLM